MLSYRLQSLRAHILYRLGWPLVVFRFDDGSRLRLDWRHPAQRGIAAGAFEPAERRLLHDCVPVGSVVVDVGAHIGTHTIALAQSVGPTGRVIALGSLHQRGSSLRELQVRVTTVDAVVPATDHVAFIKVDVEGAELQALVGATQTIQRCRPLLLCEISQDADAIHAILAAHGYHAQPIAGTTNTLFMPTATGPS